MSFCILENSNAARATTSSESGTSTLVAPTGEVWLFDLGSNRWRQAISVGGPLAGNSAVATSIGPVSWVGVQLYQFDDTTEHWTELDEAAVARHSTAMFALFRRVLAPEGFAGDVPDAD